MHYDIMSETVMLLIFPQSQRVLLWRIWQNETGLTAAQSKPDRVDSFQANDQ
jgi:hypothetical protein